MSKKLSKYIVVFHYADKIFIVLSATFGTLSVVSHATVVGILVGLVSGSLTVVFSLTTGIVKKLLSVSRKKKKKHNKITILAKSKLNSIETLMTQALIDLDISHEEFKTIVNKNEKHKKMKEDIRTMKSRDELSENSRDIIRENIENADLNKYIFLLLCIKWLLLLFKIMQMQNFTQ